MTQPTLDQLLMLDWTLVYSDEGDGTFSVRVLPLLDLVLYGTREELEATWMEALASHLQGYLNCGKAVPLPTQFSEVVALNTEGVISTSFGSIKAEGDAFVLVG